MPQQPTQPFIRPQILQWEEEGVPTGSICLPNSSYLSSLKVEIALHLQQWDWHRAGAQMFAEYCGMKKGGIKSTVTFSFKGHLMGQWI